MDEPDPFAAGVGGARADDAAPDTAPPVDMDVGPILGRCVELMKAHPGLVIGTVFVSVAPGLVLSGVDTALQIYAAFNRVSDEFAAMSTMARIAITLTSVLIGVWLQLGVARIFLNLARGGTAELTMIVGQGRHYLSALLATLLFLVAYLGGLLLLIVPGIIALTGLQFFVYAMVDKELGPIEALAESWRLTHGHKLTIFLINLVFGIVGTLFCCATLGLGYFLVLPLMSLAAAVMYHALTHLQQEPA